LYAAVKLSPTSLECTANDKQICTY